MQRWSVEPYGVLDIDEDTSPKRELYIEQMRPVKLAFEASLEEAYPVFNAMPEVTLPTLPWGYQWARHDGKHSIIRDKMADKHKLKLILYGPNPEDQINFLFQVDDVTHYSFAHTKTGADPSRSYPMGKDDYKVPGFDYSETRYKSHVKGHLIDHKDTIKAGPKEKWSTYDSRNYVPEPPEYEWGMGIRNQAVADLRKTPGKTAYAQTLFYPAKAKKTRNHTPVPEGTYFTRFSVDGNVYKRLTIFDVNWDENMKRPAGVKVLDHANTDLSSPKEAVPIVNPFSPVNPDRTLRLHARKLGIAANSIADGTIECRNPYRAEFSTRIGAAEKEFEQSNKKLQAAITADEGGKVQASLQYVKRSLSYAEELQDHDEPKPFDKDISKQGLLLFKNKENDAAWGDVDVESLSDQFRGLTHK